MIPGIKPRSVSPILINKSTPHPFSKNTPRGGRRNAKINLQISLHVNAMISKCGTIKLNFEFN